MSEVTGRVLPAPKIQYGGRVGIHYHHIWSPPPPIHYYFLPHFPVSVCVNEWMWLVCCSLPRCWRWRSPQLLWDHHLYTRGRCMFICIASGGWGGWVYVVYFYSSGIVWSAPTRGVLSRFAKLTSTWTRTCKCLAWRWLVRWRRWPDACSQRRKFSMEDG